MPFNVREQLGNLSAHIADGAAQVADKANIAYNAVANVPNPLHQTPRSLRKGAAVFATVATTGSYVAIQFVQDGSNTGKQNALLQMRQNELKNFPIAIAALQDECAVAQAQVLSYEFSRDLELGKAVEQGCQANFTVNLNLALPSPNQPNVGQTASPVNMPTNEKSGNDAVSGLIGHAQLSRRQSVIGQDAMNNSSGTDGTSNGTGFVQTNLDALLPNCSSTVSALLNQQLETASKQTYPILPQPDGSGSDQDPVPVIQIPSVVGFKVCEQAFSGHSSGVGALLIEAIQICTSEVAENMESNTVNLALMDRDQKTKNALLAYTQSRLDAVQSANQSATADVDALQSSDVKSADISAGLSAAVGAIAFAVAGLAYHSLLRNPREDERQAQADIPMRNLRGHDLEHGDMEHLLPGRVPGHDYEDQFGHDLGLNPLGHAAPAPWVQFNNEDW